MHKGIRGVILGFGLAAIVGQAQAADGSGRFGIKGVGGAPCETYLQAFEKKDQGYLMYLGWLGGYISATNQHLADTFDVAPWQSMGLVSMAVANVCRQNPKASFLEAVQRVLQGIYPARLAQASPMTQAKTDKATIQIYEAVLKQAQEKLKALGYYKGKADGKYGPGTRKALEAFQKDNKLQPTGLPDQATLLALMNARPAQ